MAGLVPAPAVPAAVTGGPHDQGPPYLPPPPPPGTSGNGTMLSGWT